MCAVAQKRVKYHQRLKQLMEESSCMPNAMELWQNVPTVEEFLSSYPALSHLPQTVVVIVAQLKNT